jgi:hypothetical protein
MYRHKFDGKDVIYLIDLWEFVTYMIKAAIYYTRNNMHLSIGNQSTIYTSLWNNSHI